MRNFKFLFSVIFITTFSLMVTAQIMLKNSFLKNRLSFLHEMESRYVYSEKVIDSGYIVIEISAPSDNLFLLQNGEKILSLSKKQIKVDISDNSVIEIDGRYTDSKCNIKITEISDKTNGFYENEVNVDSNIVILGRFFVK